MTATNAVRIERHFNHPPAAIWRALTDPALHARWWAAGDVKAEVGHRFTLDMGPWGHTPCEVLAVEPERLLQYAFATSTLNTIITWQIEADGAGTRLTLTHGGFDLLSAAGRNALEGMGRGWPAILDRLATALAG